MTPGTDVDLLTRTTLQVDGTAAGASLTHVIGALQRVPGVLLAEVDAATARAVVAHDAAVLASSLIAAAQNVGVRARVVADTRPPVLTGNSATQLRSLGNRQLPLVAAAALVVVAIVDVLVPNAAQKHWTLIVLTASLWAFFLAKSLLGQRRS